MASSSNSPQLDAWITRNQNKAKVEELTTYEMYDILAQLESVWFDDKTPDRFHVNKTVSNILCRHLQNAPNPYSLTIFLLENSKDFLTFKTTSLSFFVLKELDKWLNLPQNRNRIDKARLLNEEIRTHVYKVTAGKNFTYFDMAVKVYEMNHKGNDYFVPLVRYNIDNQKFKEASVAITKLRLQRHFKINDVIIPLLLQDKVNLLENYVIGQPDQQREVVQMLDNLCDRSTSIEDFINNSGVELTSVKRGQLNRKTLSKLAVRLMKLYEIPANLCPNITNARGLGAIKYLLYKRYIEMSMGSGSWEEMVLTAVGDNDYLKEQLVEQLMCYNDLQEAVKWTKNFRLPDSKIPLSVLEAREKFSQQLTDEAGCSTTGDEEENWDSQTLSDKDMSVFYHQLVIPLDHITMVDSRDSLEKCSKRLSVPGSVIGIDSEWKPTMGTEKSGISIMQLAVHDHIFLLDMMTLIKTLSREEISYFIQLVFCNEETVKLGYGFDADLHMVVKSLPYLKDILLCMKRFVDIEGVSSLVLKRNSDNVMLDESKLEDEDEDRSDAAQEPVAKVVTSFSKSEEKGLSELVRQCFGKPLCKNEQMSNWERRPLRQEQIVYAS
ncbi:hypothetical protein SNE40_015537 [Patella caerulea]|uniref:3'-5' exonuclease domain-containing protein n=1 Tax=Patella caerulea TaxID=87958 RepID=A0AAN8PJD8_PATCE